MKRLLLVPVLSLGMLASSAMADAYKVDPVHSHVVYRITHANAGASWGRFVDPTGTFERAGDELKLDITVDVKNLTTDNKQRDEHVSGPDLFNVQQFPTMTFKSKSSKKTSDGWDVTGDLTVKGRAKEITVHFKQVGEADSPQMGHRVGIETEVTIDRMEYGLDGWPDMLGHDVRMFIAFEGVRQ